MTKAVIPIVAVRYEHEDAFDLEAFEVFAEHGLNGDDDLTFTMRVSTADETARDRIREAMRARLPDDQARRLLQFMDENEWDVSFLVDCF